MTDITGRKTEVALMGVVIALALVCFWGKVQIAQAAPPPETQELLDWQQNYKRHAVEGAKLFDLGKYESAIKAYTRAVNGSEFNYAKAGKTRNIALALLLIAKRDNDRGKAKEALQTYKQATLLLIQADLWCSDGCKHPTDCKPSRDLTRLHIKQGSGAAKRWLKTGK